MYDEKKPRPYTFIYCCPSDMLTDVISIENAKNCIKIDTLMKSETTSYERERILKEDAIVSYHIVSYHIVISIKETKLRKTG